MIKLKRLRSISTMIQILLEILLFLVKVYIHWIQSILLFFIPTRFIAKDIRGKTVLITGAGGGIGRLLADKFAALGCRLVLWDVDEKSNTEILDRVRAKHKADAVAYSVDLSDRESVYKAAEKVSADFAPVDILVNNAGIVFGKNVLESSDAQMVKTMEVNCFAHYWTSKAFLPNMIKNDYGHLVTIASSAGLFGAPGMADYCASKFAAVGFEESLRYELAKKDLGNVKTTVVCPFLIATEMFQGCKMRVPFVLDALDPDYVACCIVDAVLRNKEVLFIPRTIYLFFLFKAIVPAKCQYLVNEFLGATSLMNTFVGRHQKTR